MTSGGAKRQVIWISFGMSGVNTTEVAARWGAFLRDPQNVDVAAGLKQRVEQHDTTVAGDAARILGISAADAAALLFPDSFQGAVPTAFPTTSPVAAVRLDQGAPGAGSTLRARGFGLEVPQRTGSTGDGQGTGLRPAAITGRGGDFRHR